MKTKVEKEAKTVLGLIEMNESQQKEVTGGSPLIVGFDIKSILQQCCGLVMSVDIDPITGLPPSY